MRKNGDEGDEGLYTGRKKRKDIGRAIPAKRLLAQEFIFGQVDMRQRQRRCEIICFRFFRHMAISRKCYAIRCIWPLKLHSEPEGGVCGDPVAHGPITTLSMPSDSTIQKCLVRFNKLSLLTGWNDQALRKAFYDGLPRALMSLVRGHPGNFPIL